MSGSLRSVFTFGEGHNHSQPPIRTKSAVMKMNPDSPSPSSSSKRSKHNEEQESVYDVPSSSDEETPGSSSIVRSPSIGLRYKKMVTEGHRVSVRGKAPVKTAHPIRKRAHVSEDNLPHSSNKTRRLSFENATMIVDTPLAGDERKTLLRHIHELLAENEELRRRGHLSAMREKQDILLNDIIERERSKRKVRRLQERLANDKRLLEKAQQEASTSDKAVAKLTAELDITKTELQKEQAETMRLKKVRDDLTCRYKAVVAERSRVMEEIDELNVDKAILAGDLDQLRQIEIEDSALKHRRALGLPPAYGSLDDEDEQPPWTQEHVDQGRMHFSTFERVVRNDFLSKMVDAFRYAETARADQDVDLQEVANHLFYFLAIALQKSSRIIRCVLLSSEGILYTPNESDIEGIATRFPGLGNFIGEDENAALIGASAAKLILDLYWQATSATQLRPSIITLSGPDNARAGLALKEIDDTLLEALRLVFGVMDDRKVDEKFLEYRFHYWETLVLQAQSYTHLSPITYRPFQKTSHWLGLQTDAWRCRAANNACSAEVLPAPGFHGLP